MGKTSRSAIVEELEFYHGLLPREDIPHLLLRPGDFLLRQSETAAGQARQLIFSVMLADNAIKHVIVRRNPAGKWATDNTRPFFDGLQELVAHYVQSGESMLPHLAGVVLGQPVMRAPWELRHGDVELGAKLGEGAFGEVKAGTLLLPSKRRVDVAVKLAKTNDVSKEKIKEIMKEARLMRNFEHPNVVKLYGVCVETEPLMIVMELLHGGALDEYLKKNRVPAQEKLDNMCMGVAWGLEYLHARNCIHRDIAARNVLYSDMTASAEGAPSPLILLLQAKISDFGMSREGSHYKMPTGRRVPMKWLAPEVIASYLFSPKSDVWAFGVVVWEVYADGTEPFRGVNNAELKNQILGGTRLEFPADTPPPVVELVLNDCWAAQAEQRATMAQVARKLEQITGMSPPSPAADKPPAAPAAELQPKRRQSTGRRKPEPSARLKARRSSKNTRTREYTRQD